MLSSEIFNVMDAIDVAPEKYPLYDASGNVIEGSYDALGQCFPITDFYLHAAAAFPVYGKEPAHLTLIDAGKPETLLQAERFISQS